GPRVQPGGGVDNRGSACAPKKRCPDDWGYIYGLLSTACGYSYPVIDEMTLFDLEELTAYWAEHPPLHILVGAYLGIGKHRHKGEAVACQTQAPAANSDMAALLAELGPGFGAGDVHTGLAPVVLDFSELQRRTKAGD